MKFTLSLLVLGCAMVATEAKSAEASHILVKDEAKCQELKTEIEGGNVEFSDAAKEHSTQHDQVAVESTGLLLHAENS